MKKISLLIPAHNEEESLPILYKELLKIIDNHSEYLWEILFVNDGSSDKTLDIIKEMRANDNRISYVDLSRNFGKERALLAGYDYVTGDCMVIMDADLQDPPYVMEQMIAKWEEGYDDVYGKRIHRGKESWLKKVLSKTFYRTINRLSDIDMLPNVGDFRLLDRKCIDALKKLRESERYNKGLFCWIGYRKACIEFVREERVKGQTSYNFAGLFQLALDGIFSFSTVPIKLSMFAGVITSLCAFCYMIYVLLKAFLFGDPVAGFPTLMTVILFIGGLMLLCLGIIGEYVGRIFNEVKNRPIYLVREYNGEPISKK